MSHSVVSRPDQDLDAWAAANQQATRDQEISSDCAICHGQAQWTYDLEYNPQLCFYCQFWNDARHPLSCIGAILGSDYRGPPPRQLSTLAENRNCILCQLISTAVHERVKGEDTEKLEVLVGNPYHYSQDYRFPPEVKHAAKHPVVLKSVILVVYAADAMSSLELLKDHILLGPGHGSETPLPPYVIGVQVKLCYSEFARHLQTIVRWGNPHFSTQEILNQVDRCEAEHYECRQIATKDLPDGMMLIDVQSMSVVEAPKDARFAALSYAWRAKPYQQFQQLKKTTLDYLGNQGSLDYHSIPRLIWDAILLCSDLKVQYLWVDRLCIVQDDLSAMKSQIMAMDAIYQGATMTIVAANDAGEHPGLPGVSQHPRTSSIFDHMRTFQISPVSIRENVNATINNSRWNTRGWTFQERLLSRRVILLAEHQSYFLCSQSAYQEDIGIIDNLRSLPRSTLRNEVTTVTNVTTLSRYFDCVDEYTSRDLSYDSDILNAFAGVTSYLSERLHTSFMYGMPERYLIRSFLWAQVDSNPLERRDAGFPIPSWSWAAWKGGVQYVTALGNYHIELLEDVGYNASDYGTLIRMFVLDECGKLRKVEVEERWFQEDVPFAQIENAALPNEKTAVAAYWKADPTQVWNACPQNPWTVFSHGLPDQKAVNRAKGLEGALIFKSTIASLSIRHRTRYLDRAVVDICDWQGRSVGRMQRMTNEWMSDHLDFTKKYQFIALCAGVFPPIERRGPYRDKDLWDSEGYMNHLWKQDLLVADPLNRNFDIVDRDPWVLRVMMVEEDEINNGVFRRIAIGFVETRCWVYCQPQWATVVLV